MRDIEKRNTEVGQVVRQVSQWCVLLYECLEIRHNPQPTCKRAREVLKFVRNCFCCILPHPVIWIRHAAQGISLFAMQVVGPLYVIFSHWSQRTHLGRTWGHGPMRRPGVRRHTRCAATSTVTRANTDRALGIVFDARRPTSTSSHEHLYTSANLPH